MSQEISNYPLVIPSYYYDMGYQIPPFFVALTPDMNGHCNIDDSYYAYYEATLDDYYSCLSGAKKTPPITKENVKCNVMNNAIILLTFVNRTLQRLRVGNEDNHLPTYIRTEAQTICSMERTGCAEGYIGAGSGITIRTLINIIRANWKILVIGSTTIQCDHRGFK